MTMTCSSCRWWGWKVDPETGHLDMSQPVCKVDSINVEKHGTDFCSYWELNPYINDGNVR